MAHLDLHPFIVVDPGEPRTVVVNRNLTEINFLKLSVFEQGNTLYFFFQ